MDHVITEATVHVDDDLGIRLEYDNPDATAVVVSRDLLEDMIARSIAFEKYVDQVIAPNVATAIECDPGTRLHELFMAGLLGQVTLRVDAWQASNDAFRVTVTTADTTARYEEHPVASEVTP